MEGTKIDTDGLNLKAKIKFNFGDKETLREYELFGEIIPSESMVWFFKNVLNFKVGVNERVGKFALRLCNFWTNSSPIFVVFILFGLECCRAVSSASGFAQFNYLLVLRLSFFNFISSHLSKGPFLLYNLTFWIQKIIFIFKVLISERKVEIVLKQVNKDAWPRLTYKWYFLTDIFIFVKNLKKC